MAERLMGVFITVVSLGLTALIMYVFLPEMIEKAVRKIVRIVYDERAKIERRF